MNKEKIVYLAGPITGLNYEGATDWREYAKKRLAEFGITGVSPMRAKGFLKNLKAIGSGVQDDPHGIGQPKGFVTRDRLDVSRCDAVLMNLKGATTVSIGTMVEVGWADAFRKPVVLVMEPPMPTEISSSGDYENRPIVAAVPVFPNIHEHGFVRQLTQYHNTDLDTAIETIAAILQD